HGGKQALASGARARGRVLEVLAHGAAEAVEAGDALAALAPAEHPGDGAQVLDAVAALARRWAAADVQLGDLVDGCGLAEVADEARRAVDEVAVGGEGPSRQVLHRFVKG